MCVIYMPSNSPGFGERRKQNDRHELTDMKSIIPSVLLGFFILLLAIVAVGAAQAGEV